MHRRNFIAGALGLPLLARPGAAQAQAGLTKIIFPFAAGAGGDTLCRLIAQEMAPLLRTQVVPASPWLRVQVGDRGARGGAARGGRAALLNEARGDV